MPYQRDRPGWITALGVINVVLGSLGVLGSCGNTVFTYFLPQIVDQDGGAFFGRNPETLEQFRAMTEPEWYWTCLLVFGAVGVLSTTLLLVGGVGLLKQARWGRSLTLAWAVISLCMTVIVLAITLAAGKFEPMSGLGLAIGLAYPIVLLAFLLPPHRAAAFARAR